MSTTDRSSTTFAAILGMLVLFSLCGCVQHKKTPSTTTLKVHNQILLQAKTILAKGGKFAENAMRLDAAMREGEPVRLGQLLGEWAGA